MNFLHKNLNMVENTLFEALETYNKDVANTYKDNWGSLLSFISKHSQIR
jgi:hypothetical protein